MEIIRNLDYVGKKYKKCVLAIGVFDGLHLGHQDIIKKVIKKARELKKKSVLVTFDPHPAKILNFHNDKNKEGGFLITTLEEKIELIRGQGIDCLAVIKFNEVFLNITPQEFISRIAGSFKPGYIVVGHNHTFGKGGAGNPSTLNILGRLHGFKTIILKPKKLDNNFISSTAIRKILKAGDAGKASSMLGKYFFMHGRVVHGRKRGLSLGFPTANMDISKDKLIPGDGVYVCIAKTGGKAYRSLVNIGFSPTFESKNKKRTVEVFIENFRGNLYGRNLRIDFVSRLRGETKFINKNALREQIQKDMEMAEKLLKNKTILNLPILK